MTHAAPPGIGQRPPDLTSQTTAASLVLLLPGVCPTSSPNIVERAWATVSGLPATAALAGEIEAELAAAGFIDYQSASLNLAIKSAATAALKALGGAGRNRQDVRISQPDPTAGVTLTTKGASGGNVPLSITNVKDRYVAFFNDPGTTKYLGDAASAHLLNPVNIQDVFDFLVDPAHSVFTPGSLDVSAATSSSGATTLLCYSGLPLPVIYGLSDPGLFLDPGLLAAIEARFAELSTLAEQGFVGRIVQPTIETAVFSILFPILEIITGADPSTCADGLLESLTSGQAQVFTNLVDRILANDSAGVLAALPGVIFALIQPIIECAAPILIDNAAAWIHIISAAHGIIELASEALDSYFSPITFSANLQIIGATGSGQVTVDGLR